MVPKFEPSNFIRALLGPDVLPRRACCHPRFRRLVRLKLLQNSDSVLSSPDSFDKIESWVAGAAIVVGHSFPFAQSSNRTLLRI
jgi:hypothetical protein